MNYKLVTYIFLMLSVVAVGAGMAWLEFNQTLGFGYIGSVVTGYFINKGWKNRKNKQ